MMKDMSCKDIERAWRQVKKDSDIFNGVMHLVHSKEFLNEPFDKAMARLSRRPNIDSLIRIAKDRSISPNEAESIAARKMAIRILSRMNEKAKDERILKTLLELLEDRDKEVSECAVNSLPCDIKEDRIGLLMRDLEREEDSNKRWDIFIKIYPFMDEKLADRIFAICDEKEDTTITTELLHFVNRLSLN